MWNASVERVHRSTAFREEGISWISRNNAEGSLRGLARTEEYILENDGLLSKSAKVAGCKGLVVWRG